MKEGGEMLTSGEARHLEKMAWVIRRNIIEMISGGKVGHLGGSCSVAEILSVLYFHRMKGLDGNNPKNPERDRIIFSKGHAVLAQYAALVELGYFPREEMKKLKTLGGLLQGHPDMKTPGIEAVTGSLGQGLSVASGMALGLRLDGSKSKVFAVLGDGELAEGQIWEAVMSSADYKLGNLCAFVDKNSVQATGATKDIFPIEDIPGRFRSFGWNVIEIDGHDVCQVEDAIEKADETKDRPTVIIALTVKGKGFPFAEGKAAYHNAGISEDEYKEALAIVGGKLKEYEDA